MVEKKSRGISVQNLKSSLFIGDDLFKNGANLLEFTMLRVNKFLMWVLCLSETKNANFMYCKIYW